MVFKLGQLLIMIVGSARTALSLGCLLLLTACISPVGVSRVDIQTAYAIQTENALSARQPSEESQIVLRRLNLLDRFDRFPEQVLKELHQGLSTTGDDDRLFALAELSFLVGEKTGNRGHYLASALYAWALLFPGDKAVTSIPPTSPRYRLTFDIYNQAVAKGLKKPDQGREKNDELLVEPGTYELPFGKLTISLDHEGLSWGGYKLDHYLPTTSLSVRGFRNRYHSSGIGVPLSASLADRKTNIKAVGAERLGARTRVPMNALLRFANARADLKGSRFDGNLEISAADQAASTRIDNRDIELEFDTTVPLASMLDGSPLYQAEVTGFFRGGILSGFLQKDRTQDGLFMLQPYRAGKIPLVLVHGTASSPARWAELVNELQGDPRIRDTYQIWFFTYDSGNPIVYSAGRLRTALKNIVMELDPTGKDPALQRMVIMGHSQGGLLTKFTAVDSGNRFWDRLSDRPIDQVKIDPDSRELLRQSLFFKPMPFVGRVIFVATPHRGALLAAGRLGSLVTRLVKLPMEVFSRATEALRRDGNEKLLRALKKPPTAVDNMNPESPALNLLASLPVDSPIPAHSIIAVDGVDPVETGDDGVVAYRSAHIEGVESELVVRSNHSCQGKPEVIEEVRRILMEHSASKLATP